MGNCFFSCTFFCRNICAFRRLFFLRRERREYEAMLKDGSVSGWRLRAIFAKWNELFHEERALEDDLFCKAHGVTADDGVALVGGSGPGRNAGGSGVGGDGAEGAEGEVRASDDV